MPSDRDYFYAAREIWASRPGGGTFGEDDIEIDDVDDADLARELSVGDDGAWVRGWLWVDKQVAEECAEARRDGGDT